jgi:ATP-dependent Clp protease adaptor protein ClpS
VRAGSNVEFAVLPGLEEAIEPGGLSAERTAGPWVVILYNCDCHSFEEVILQLQKATGCSLEEADLIAMEAHIRGRVIAYTGEAVDCERVAGVLRSIRLQVETDTF